MRKLERQGLQLGDAFLDIPPEMAGGTLAVAAALVAAGTARARSAERRLAGF